MTDAAAFRTGEGGPDGASRSGAPAELYRNGYALVVHASDMPCRELANLVTRQCEALGIDVVRLPIHEVSFEKLYRYTALFLVLRPPGRAGGATTTVEAFGRVYAAYREVRPKGLTSVLRAESDWQWAGPVQVLLLGSDGTDHPALQALRQACVVRTVTDVRALGDLFDVYHEANTSDPGQTLVREAIKRWTYLKTWKVPTLADVPVIRQLIEDQVKHYDNARFSKTSQPLPDVPHNRLYLVLHHPERAPRAKRPEHMPPVSAAQHAKDKKNFIESGAKVVRETIKVINHKYPMIERPEGRKNTKGNQDDFKLFYDALLLIDTLPSVLRAHIPES